MKNIYTDKHENDDSSNKLIRVCYSEEYNHLYFESKYGCQVKDRLLLA